MSRTFDSIHMIRLVPTNTSSIYSILFTCTFVLSIILVNSGEHIFKSYTSCHGDDTYDITWIGLLVLLQCILLLPKVERSNTVETESNTTDASKTLLKNDSTADNSKYDYSQTNISMLISKNVSFDNDNESHSEIEKTCQQSQWTIATDKLKTNFRICWNSLWMLFYHFILFLGMHATLLASRIHGIIDLNRYAIDTCSHLSDFPFALTSPALKVPLISEAVFIVVYLSFTVHELIIRKTGNSAHIRNFVGSHYFKESKILGVLRLMLQLVIFSAVLALIIRSFFFGYGSPMHILVGFSLAMLMLWINSVLARILQLTYIQQVKTTAVDFNWLWSILSGATLWCCGFLFYTSVYGIPYYTLYIYIHLLAWVLLLLITYYRGSQIFVLTNITHGWSSTFG